MHYFIDGYNLLFAVSHETRTLEEAREHMINSLITAKLSITIVFDGKGGMHDRTHKGSLEIIYTAKGQSADAYIIEEISYAKNPKIYTVVTSDKNLSTICCQTGSYAKSIHSFLSLIQKKDVIKAREKPYKDSDKELMRLLKIFTDLDKKQ